MIADSLREYYVLAELALANRNYWVVTHGEPHWANQFIVCDELFLVDWDTIALAPPEFDAVDLPLSARVAMVCDEQMLRMFRLERQLTEITEYAEWFESNHTGTEDDRDALDRLRKELRPV
jgi:spectinomycin phosphotransferase